MNNKITDELVEALTRALHPGLYETDGLLHPALARSGQYQAKDKVRAALESVADSLPRFTYTEGDLLQLARGIVPEWLRFDADAALDEELSK